MNQDSLLASRDLLKSLPSDRFNGEWRKMSAIYRCSVSDVDEFIACHYLHKRPGVITLCLKMLVEDLPVGTVIYAMPPREINKRYGGHTWELARLFLIDEIPRNAETWLIAQSIRYIKLNHPDVQFLVSYADPSANHVGTIYKAANWKADGRTDMERKSPRCDYVDVNGKKYARKAHVPNGVDVTRKPRISKYGYFFPL